MQPSENYSFPSTDESTSNKCVIPQNSSDFETNIFFDEGKPLGDDSVSYSVGSEGNLHLPQDLCSSNMKPRETKGFEFHKISEQTFVRNSNMQSITRNTNQIEPEMFSTLPSYSSPNVFFASEPSNESKTKTDGKRDSSEAHELSDENFDDSQSFSQKMYVQSPESAYIALVPLINKLSPSNICGLLTETLRLSSHQIPLDDFFVLLYGDLMPSMNSSAVTGPKFDEAEKQFTAEGLRLCELILRTLRYPGIAVGPFAAGLVKNKQLFPIKFNEVRRNFLAIKIIFDSLTEVSGPLRSSSNISRPAINHAYSIICEKLLKQYPLIPEAQPTKQGMIIGQSQLGKIIRMMYPNSSVRRIGKRGLSSYHYVGFQWNKSLIRDEVHHILKERIHSLMAKKRLLKNTVGDDTEKWYKPQISKNIQSYNLEVHCSPMPNLSRSIPFSFINVHSKYPKVNCLPIQGYARGEIPQLSEWASGVMKSSMDALKKYRVDLDSFVDNFNAKVCSSNVPNFLFDNFMSAMKSLSGRVSFEEPYLHLYLVILLITFPLTLASNKELSCEDKLEFRGNLQNFIASLKAEEKNLDVPNSDSLHKFIDIIKRMMNLISLSPASVKTGLVNKIMKAIVCDMELPASDSEKINGFEKNKDSMSLKSIIKASKALNCDFFVDGLKAGPEKIKEIMVNISVAFSDFCSIVIESYKRIPNSLTDEDLSRDVYTLPFEIFRISLIVFHKLFISNALVAQLPVLMISFIAHEIHKGFHNLSFNDFSRRENEVSQETFKTWWAVSSMTGEYDGIMSQIAALSERLSIR